MPPAKKTQLPSDVLSMVDFVEEHLKPIPMFNPHSSEPEEVQIAKWKEASAQRQFWINLKNTKAARDANKSASETQTKE